MLAVSIVIPVYHGAETVALLVAALVERYESIYDLEIVLVDDGSPDESPQICAGLAQRFKGTVRFVGLARNFGEHNAVMAGLQRVHGDVIVIMDDDMQNPPEEVEKLVNRLQTGNFDVVFSRYALMNQGRLRKLGSRFNDATATVVLGKPRGLYLASFKSLRRAVADDVIRYRGPFPYVDGLILRITRNLGVVDCEHRPREHEGSNYTIGKLIWLWLNMLTSAPGARRRAIMAVGGLLAMAGGLGSFVATTGSMGTLQTYATGLLAALLIIAGLPLIGLGAVGEYRNRLTLSESAGQQYVVRDEVEP